jgi:Flp pilus assembly pilin Flp
MRTPAKRKAGQALVEYALIIALVAIVLVGALVALQGPVGNAITSIVPWF